MSKIQAQEIKRFANMSELENKIKIGDALLMDMSDRIIKIVVYAGMVDGRLNFLSLESENRRDIISYQCQKDYIIIEDGTLILNSLHKIVDIYVPECKEYSSFSKMLKDSRDRVV